MVIEKGQRINLADGSEYIVLQTFERKEKYVCLINEQDKKDVQVCREAQTEQGLKVVPIEEPLLLNELARKFSDIIRTEIGDV